MPARFWYHALKGLDLGGLNRATAIPGSTEKMLTKLVSHYPRKPSRSASPTSSTQSSHGWTPAADVSTACPPFSSASAKLSSPPPPLAS